MINYEFVKLIALLLVGWAIVTVPALVLLLSRRDPPNPRGPRWN